MGKYFLDSKSLNEIWFGTIVQNNHYIILGKYDINFQYFVIKHLSVFPL